MASKLIKMLLSKGVNKIIKKYGYLPVDYINKQTGMTIDESSGLVTMNDKSPLLSERKTYSAVKRTPQ